MYRGNEAGGTVARMTHSQDKDLTLLAPQQGQTVDTAQAPAPNPSLSLLWHIIKRMAFRALAVISSLALAVNGRSWQHGGGIPGGVPGGVGQIEVFNGSSYARVSENYHLVKFQCQGCVKKNVAGRYEDEHLVSGTKLAFRHRLGFPYLRDGRQC